jgi:hypothetical protein
MLSDIMLNIIELIVVTLNIIMLSVITVVVIMLSVGAPLRYRASLYENIAFYRKTIQKGTIKMKKLLLIKQLYK